MLLDMHSQSRVTLKLVYIKLALIPANFSRDVFLYFSLVLLLSERPLASHDRRLVVEEIFVALDNMTAFHR